MDKPTLQSRNKSGGEKTSRARGSAEAGSQENARGHKENPRKEDRGKKSGGWEEKRSALLIANSKYNDRALKKLRSPAEDVAALERVLKQPKLGRFGSVEVLHDKAAHVLANHIEAFFFNRSHDEVLLLYFSGHGIKDDEGHLRLAASNTSLSLLDSTSVSGEAVNKYMRKCASQKQILILDCCFGGAFAKGMVPKDAPGALGIEEYFNGQGQIVLSASNAMQYSFEADALHGKAVPSVFTEALVEGIESGNADMDEDGIITVSEAFRYVEKRLQARRSPQQPKMSGLGVSGQIILSLTNSPRGLPTEYTAMTASPFSPVRLLGAGYLGKLIAEDSELAESARRSLAQLKEDKDEEVAKLAWRIHSNPRLGASVFVVQNSTSKRASSAGAKRTRLSGPGQIAGAGDVFLNVPFTADFENLYVAYIAGVTAFGLNPRTTLELAGSRPRLEVIRESIEQCHYSLHDVSKQPGWNRALELGMTIGMHDVRRDHKWYVLNSVRFETQRVLSDLNSFDILVHEGKVEGVMRVLMSVFSSEARQPTVHDLMKRYRQLKAAAPGLMRSEGANNPFDARVFRKLSDLGLKLGSAVQ
jgi:hypothetical protein